MLLIYFEKSSSFLDYFWFFGDPGKLSFTMTKLLFPQKLVIIITCLQQCSKIQLISVFEVL